MAANLIETPRILFLDYEQPLGWFLRAMHFYAGSGMVVLVLAHHLTQVFLASGPRDLFPGHQTTLSAPARAG